MKTAFETARLLCRKISETDATELHQITTRNRDRLTDFPTTLQQLSTPDLAVEYARAKAKEWDENASYYFPMRLLTDSKLVGMIFLIFPDLPTSKIQAGYFVGEEWEGQGLVSEALQGIIGFVFEELQLERIYLRIKPGNLGSMRLAAKFGFTLEGTIRRDFVDVNGVVQDMQYFGLHAAEWRARKSE